MTNMIQPRMRYLATLAAGLLVALSAPRVDAVIVQDFESTTGTIFGDAGRQGTFGVPPFGGSFQLLLTTFNAGEGGGIAGNDIAVGGAGGLQSQLALPSGTITFPGAAPLGGGSAFQMSLGALNVGDTVGFSYDFLTSEGGHPDFAFAALQNTTTGAVTYIVFANANQSGLTALASLPNFDLHSGYLTAAGIGVTVAGNYTLSIGVADAQNNNTQSGLLLDNITVSPVPEPSTLALAAVGIVGAAALIRRRRLA